VLKAAHAQDMIFWNFFFLSLKLLFFLLSPLLLESFPVGIVVLVGGVKLLPLGVVDD
jgi:hypothetical protein